jgi:hypothetical protein
MFYYPWLLFKPVKSFDGAGLDIADTTSGVTNDIVEENLFVDLSITTHTTDHLKSAETNWNVAVNTPFSFPFLLSML